MELTTRLRKDCFKAILRQDEEYFDDPMHTTSVLCGRLSSDASLVQGMTGAKMGLIFKNFSSLGILYPNLSFCYSLYVLLAILILLYISKILLLKGIFEIK